MHIFLFCCLPADAAIFPDSMCLENFTLVELNYLELLDSSPLPRCLGKGETNIH